MESITEVSRERAQHMARQSEELATEALQLWVGAQPAANHEEPVMNRDLALYQSFLEAAAWTRRSSGSRG